MAAVHFKMKVWFIGNWNRRNRNYDIAVTVGGDKIWMLGKDLVCSKLGNWQGNLQKHNFADQQDLSAKTCFVEISHRMIATLPLLEVTVCRISISRTRATIIGVSDATVDFIGVAPVATGTKYFSDVSTSVTVADADRMNYFFLATDMTSVVSYTASNIWKQLNPFSLTVSNFLDVNNSPVGLHLSLNMKQMQGPQITSIEVTYSQCALATSCNEGISQVTVSNTDSWISSGVKTFDVTLPNTYLPYKTQVRLCSTNFGCSATQSDWNIDLKYFDENNQISSVNYEKLTGKQNWILKAEFVPIDPSSVMNYALPTSRSVMWWHDIEDKMKYTLTLFIACFNFNDLSDTFQPIPLFYWKNLPPNSVRSCSAACKSLGYIYFAVSEKDTSWCMCGQNYVTGIGLKAPLYPTECGQPCVGEEHLFPTHYCGTSQNSAVYRSEVMVIENSKDHEHTVFGIPGTSVPETKLFDCNLRKARTAGFVMYTPSHVPSRFGESSLSDPAEHLTCIYYNITQDQWFVAKDTDFTPFVPLMSDLILAGVDGDEITMFEKGLTVENPIIFEYNKWSLEEKSIPDLYNCLELPTSMGESEKNYANGCPGAVWSDGSFSEDYCDGNNGEFPWWNYCCQWKDESCQPKQLISSVASHQYGYVNDDKINPMNIRWQNATSNRLIVNHKNFNQFHLPGQIFSGKQSMNFASVSQHSGNTNLLVTILPQSTELIAIVNKGGSGCTNSAKCNKCEGDCDTDNDCVGSLKCFQRGNSETVPGCSVGGPYNYSFCYSTTDEESLLVSNEKILDIPGTLPASVATRLCVDRGQDYPELCTSSVQNNASRKNVNLELPENIIQSMIVLNAQGASGLLDRHDAMLKFRPMLFWGYEAANELEFTTAFEIRIKRLNSASSNPPGDTCVARDNLGKCTGFPQPGSVLEFWGVRSYCRFARSPKGRPLVKPSYIYSDDQTDECATQSKHQNKHPKNGNPQETDVYKYCVENRIKTNELPMCACSGEVCSTAALSSNFPFEYEAFVGDLYANSVYQFQVRSVLYRSVSEIRRSSLVDIGPTVYSDWSPWSSSVQTPAGKPPSQPPHPEVLAARITSVEFRIWRTQWNGKPVKHYIFEMAADNECAVLNNLNWEEIPRVIIPVNSTFSPYIDFLRGDPFKGGIGPALAAGIKFHYRVRAVNFDGEESVNSNFFRYDTVQTGVVAHPVEIYQNRPSWFVNRTSCFDVLLDQPRCSNIHEAISSFEELIDVRFGLTPDIYYWDSPIVFQREGASVIQVKSLFPGPTPSDIVIVDCMGGRCFKECKEPIYLPEMIRRCFGPSRLAGITFRNASSIDGSGSVLSRWENVKFSQRRKMVVEDCIFEHNVAFGNGGALFFHGITQEGGITISSTIFKHNIAIGGSGGALTFDSCQATLTDVTFTNNSAFLPTKCLLGRCNNEIIVNDTEVMFARRRLNNDNNNATQLNNNTNSTNYKNSINSSTFQLTLIEANPFGNGGALALISTSAGCVVEAEGLIIINNFAEAAGGGFYSQGSSFVAKRVANRTVSLLIENNKATLGGNVYISKSGFNTTAISDMKKISSIPMFSIVKGISIKDGGGIACVGSTLHLENTEIGHNSASYSGGGIFGVLCLLESISSLVHMNDAALDGGGVYLESLSAASILSSQISSNYAKGTGGGIYSRYSDTFQFGNSILDNNDAAQGGGFYIEDSWNEPLIAGSRIVYNNARDGGGGGILWERTPPTLLQNVVIKFNTAQYGSQMASGIAKLLTNLQYDLLTTNTDPIFPEISVQIVDHYGNIVRRRNQATTVVVTVFSMYCMYRDDNTCAVATEQIKSTEIPRCHNCLSAAQSVSGKPAQEIPGMDGMVNFTGLGIKAWPGNHTIRLEIDRIKPVFRMISIEDCQPGQFLDIKKGVDGGTCALCPSGFHKNIDGIHPCTSCSAGFACIVGATDPYPCTSGQYSVRESPRCSDCGLGQFQPTPMSGACIGCLSGTFANETSSTYCHDCMPGLAAETDYAVVCTICSFGRYSKIVRAVSCKDCPRGYASGANATRGKSCGACQPGSYSANPGSQACTRCATGKRTAFAAMSECGDCPSGTASGGEQSTTCQICKHGQYAEGVGNKDCIFCPSGWHATGNLNTVCTMCVKGTACNRGSGIPEICMPGYFSPRDASNDCTKCTIGTASTQPKSSICQICQPGTFAKNMNSTKCTKCPIGEYIGEIRSAACRSCPRGWSASTVGSPQCQKCEPKWRSSNRIDPGDGSELCIKCLLGEVQPPDSGECHYCKPDTYSLEAGERFAVSKYITNKENPDIGKVFPIGATKWGRSNLLTLIHNL